MSAGVKIGYDAKYGEYNASLVSDFLLRDLGNPSSVMSCIETARSNARMVRTALTREAWESVNETWMILKSTLAEAVPETDLPRVLDQIKRETAIIRGAFHGTMLRNEIFNFARIGTFIERADNTARI
ncbi:alpha-E domain-containing protein, partial [Escherichia coli]|nr:alpha-E domain-containing protein [Escherichia coli]